MAAPTHDALPHLHQQRAGDIVNISSVASDIARRGAAVCSASKWAVHPVSESLQKVTEPGSGSPSSNPAQ